MILKPEHVIGRRIAEVFCTESKYFDENPRIEVCIGYVLLDNDILFNLDNGFFRRGEPFCDAPRPLPELFPKRWPKGVVSPNGGRIVDIVTCDAPSVGVILDDDRVLVDTDAWWLFAMVPCLVEREWLAGQESVSIWNGATGR